MKEIMPMGDSITVGITPYLPSILGLNNIVFVGKENSGGYNNAGVGGERTDELYARLATELTYFNRSGKDIILLHIGTNDITESINPSTIVDNVQSILDLIELTNANSHIYVSLIIPRVVGAEDTKTTTYNTALNSMLLTYQSIHTNVYIVDMNTVFKSNENWATDYYTDTTHPNAVGYNLMANTWKSSMALNGD